MPNQKIQAIVTAAKKTEAEHNDFGDKLSGILTFFQELTNNKISLRLVSADKTVDPNNIELGGKIGEAVYLEKWVQRPNHGDIEFDVNFDWNEDFGTPGAILVQNHHNAEFYLKSVELKNVPGHQGPIKFTCESWVYSWGKDYNKTDRVFFADKTYLPHETPTGLFKYREEELRTLRGNGKDEELKESDRVYDYAKYNDLGDPDTSLALQRPVLGGSVMFPYPRRGRTSRKPSNTDKNTESKPAGVGIFKIYIPRDERFRRSKKLEFQNNSFRSFLNHRALPKITEFFDPTPDEFDSLSDVDKLYSTYPVPQVIQADRDKPSAWRTDEEFAREMLAGVNPLVIRLLKEFPPTSKLDPYLYGNQNSTITEQHIQHNLEGVSCVKEAVESSRLFILDHHDTVMPYLRRINHDTSTKTYASRTILFLKNDGTLKPVAIELSLPHPEGDRFGAVSRVYTPAEHGIEGSIWQFAKAFVAINDCGHHQLISHWLNTHAVLEPFIIATNRQLSALHPIYKLLHPHYRDTMAINALAREVLINADGLVEKTFYPGKYSLELTSIIYKDWNFLDEALPNDLKKRGIAVDDVNSPNGLRLLIEDYPFAIDGLEIWFAIEEWVRDYCSFYYKTDEMVQKDPELQAWWKELVEVGHGDKKEEKWWPKMQNCKELIQCCTIIVWIASALHASVNFGQYAYGGYSPNRPTLSRRFMPEEGTPEYVELEKNPEKAFFNTITSVDQSLAGMSLVETLSKQSPDEAYLGKEDHDWDAETLNKAYKKFQDRLDNIESDIIIKNDNGEKFKNRVGPVKVPYTLLYRTGEVGLSGKGIPNSISI
ncbi:Lipoxygenase [Corchorus olitorius]|uniref:Lipoxygenase n=1 Tax=Corchorus olitorius TaxID=93759 RepID=A0A1R3IVC2_9ROSI|nr:Lipoxygenase [Corchorus olitorius]